jgi:hypothetical protein
VPQSIQYTGMNGEKKIVLPTTTTKVELSGKGLMQWSVGKFEDFETHFQLPNYMGCHMEFYTKMSFKILIFSNRPSAFFPSNLIYYAMLCLKV